MNDLRPNGGGRNYIVTFIVGNRYVTVSYNRTCFDEIIPALEDHLEGELKKPFVILSQSLMSLDDVQDLIGRDLIDLVLE